MLICYIDESGNTGRRLDDQHQPFHLIAAVMIREDRVREMADRLDELAKRAPTREPLIEYHASELFHGSGPWEGVYPRQRIGEYAKALAVLGQVKADVAYDRSTSVGWLRKATPSRIRTRLPSSFLPRKSRDSSGCKQMR